MKRYFVLVDGHIPTYMRQLQSSSSLHENTAVDTYCIFLYVVVFQEQNTWLRYSWNKFFYIKIVFTNVHYIGSK
jgi:hypothetical protein